MGGKCKGKSRFFVLLAKLIIAFSLFFTSIAQSHAQKNEAKAIEQLILQNKNDEARNIIYPKLNLYKKNGDFAQIIELIYPYGRNLLASHQFPQAIDSVTTLVSYILSHTSDAQIQFGALREKRDFLMLVSKYQDALTTTLDMKSRQSQWKRRDMLLECRTIFEASYLSSRLYNIIDARKYLKEIDVMMSENDIQDAELEYLINFSLARNYYIELKLDSSEIYLKRSKEKLKKVRFSAYTKGYLPAILENLSAGVNGQKSNVEQAINELKHASSLLDAVPKKEVRLKEADNAGIFQCEILDNLSIQYRILREFKQAERLLLFSYHKKSTDYPFNERGLLISEVSLGSLYSEMFQFDQGIKILNKALNRSIATAPQNLIWAGDGYSSLGSMNESLNNVTEAFKYYELADQAYEIALEGYYDNVYINFLYNTSAFQAKNGRYPIARKNINKAVSYTIKTTGPDSYPSAVAYFKEAFVHYLGKNYKEAIKYANTSERKLSKWISAGENMLDSLSRANYLPFVKYVRFKSEYALHPNMSSQQLDAMLDELESEIRKLEDKKQIFGDQESIGVIQSESRAIYEFAQHIAKQLYLKTNNKKYLDILLSTHESNIYSRIRNKLDWMKIVNYSNIPQSILDREQKIIHDLSDVLSSEKNAFAYQAALSKYNTEIEAFKRKLISSHPKYYQLKYGDYHSTVAILQKKIPANTTVVKYILTENEAFVFVVGKNTSSFHVLDQGSLSLLLNALNYSTGDFSKLSGQLSGLYDLLWKPIRDKVKTSKVIIIPDKTLYKVSFESLLKKPAANVKEMGDNALIRDYVFSYDYSAALSARENRSSVWKNDFIGFAPGFSEEGKSKYRKATLGLPDHDGEYLKLISQPFTKELMRRLNSKFGGELFVGESATLTNFIKYAGDNKIIHIGSHAEANDDNPQMARLIFSKDPSDYLKDNSLWLKEIYSCNLNSELSILSACETGVSNNITGEGTISIGHAFSFAGSQSMLTALWKIDEEISMKIVSLFYENLAKGMEKDVALREAKLMFMETAGEQQISPANWAGLILMGDVAPIELQSNKLWRYRPVFIGLSIITGMAILIFVFKRRKSIRHKVA